MNEAAIDFDIQDGRPTVADADPLLERLYRIHKAPRPDLYPQGGSPDLGRPHKRPPEARASKHGTDTGGR